MPKIENDENVVFYVRENAPIDTVIGKVTAKELGPKCELRYSLWDPVKKGITQSNDQFSIDEITGELKTNREFDYEKSTAYPITFALSAGHAGHQLTKMSAEIRVLDEDDHKIHFDVPIQVVQVSEDASPSTVVATIRAVEDDQQDVFYHLGSSSPPQFSLHSTSGVVSVEQGLDREENDEFEIEIGASNEPNTPQESWPAKMKLVVKVKDVNDNGPEFDRPKYDAVVDKDTVVGSKIIEVHASDPDLHRIQADHLEYSITGASFEYRGMSRNVDGIFDIDTVTAVVSTTLPLRVHSNSVLELTTE